MAQGQQGTLIGAGVGTIFGPVGTVVGGGVGGFVSQLFGKKKGDKPKPPPPPWYVKQRVPLMIGGGVLVLGVLVVLVTRHK